jgi:hypothetical protein
MHIVECKQSLLSCLAISHRKWTQVLEHILFLLGNNSDFFVFSDVLPPFRPVVCALTTQADCTLPRLCLKLLVLPVILFLPLLLLLLILPALVLTLRNSRLLLVDNQLVHLGARCHRAETQLFIHCLLKLLEHLNHVSLFRVGNISGDKQSFDGQIDLILVFAETIVNHPVHECIVLLAYILSILARIVERMLRLQLTDLHLQLLNALLLLINFCLLFSQHNL